MSELTKQQIAQKRNYFKFVLTGMSKPIDTRVLTPFELNWWKDIMNSRKLLMEEFDRNSIKMGLNVKPKKEIE